MNSTRLATRVYPRRWSCRTIHRMRTRNLESTVSSRRRSLICCAALRTEHLGLTTKLCGMMDSEQVADPDDLAVALPTIQCAWSIARFDFSNASFDFLVPDASIYLSSFMTCRRQPISRMLELFFLEPWVEPVRGGQQRGNPGQAL